MLETEQQRMQDENEQAALSTSAEHVCQASLSPLGLSSTVTHAKGAIMGTSQSPVLGTRTNFFLYHGFFQLFQLFYSIHDYESEPEQEWCDTSNIQPNCWHTVVCVCMCVQVPASCEHPYHCFSHGNSKVDFKVKTFILFCYSFIYSCDGHY